jgi:hypothetical protein
LYEREHGRDRKVFDVIIVRENARKRKKRKEKELDYFLSLK